MMNNQQTIAVKKDGNKPSKKEESQRLWNLYHAQQRPPALREKIINKYAYLVHWAVGRFPVIDTPDFERSDLVGYGTIGLIEAVDRYDPKQNCSFETFAVSRIKGEILDYLRSRDLLSRSSRKKVKTYHETTATLERKFGRKASSEEISDAMNIDSAELAKIQKEAAALIYSLDAPDDNYSFEDASTTVLDTVASKDKTQEDLVEENLLKDKLAKSIDELPKRERLIIALYHYQKLTFREIGEVLDLSESRVSQLHMKALDKLRVMMQDFEI